MKINEELQELVNLYKEEVLFTIHLDELDNIYKISYKIKNGTPTSIAEFLYDIECFKEKYPNYEYESQ